MPKTNAAVSSSREAKTESGRKPAIELSAKPALILAHHALIFTIISATIASLSAWRQKGPPPQKQSRADLRDRP